MLDFLRVFCHYKIMARAKRRIIFLISALIFTILASAVVLYGQGYSLDQNLALSKKGGLYIASPHSGSQIFVNNKQKKVTNLLSAGIFIPNLTADEYPVLVAKDGFWPWAKNLEVTTGYVTEARAFMMPKDTDGEILMRGKFLKIWGSPYGNLLAIQEQKGDSFHLIFYETKENTFLTTDSSSSEKLLTFKKETEISDVAWEQNSFIFRNESGLIKVDFNLSNSTVFSSAYFGSAAEISDFERYTARKDEKIWWDPVTNQIFVDWLKEDSTPPYYICGHPQKTCEPPIQIFKSRFQIKNIDFYPPRKDVIIMALSNGVYALEIDRRGGQIIQPIYKGKDPIFALTQNKDFIWILDEGVLIKARLANQS